MRSSLTADPVIPADSRRAVAQAWVKTASWSMMTMRSGRATTATAGLVRSRMRVFAKGCPAACLREVLQALGEEAYVLNPVVDGLPQSGKWWHQAAIWTRDSQAQRGDPTFTIIRDFGDAPATETNVIEDGCGNRTRIRYVWDAAAVEVPADDPDYGVQGFSVKIGGVSRDPETQLYSYYVAVTERKTVFVSGDGAAAGAGVRAGDDAFSSSYDAAWLGLRGHPGDFTSDAGGAVTPWDPAAQALGELIRVRHGRNAEDCTWDVQGDRVVARRNVAAAAGCRRDVFEEVDTDSVRGAAARLGHAPAPGNGVSWDYESQLRADRLWDTRKTKTAEIQVLAASSAASDTVYQAEAVTEDRSRATDPGPASSGAGVLRSVRKSKTRGGRLNAVVTETRAKPVTRARFSRVVDVFGTREDVSDRNQASSPADLVPGGGISGSVQSEIRDHGWRDNSVTRNIETPYPGAAVAEQQTLFSRKRRVTDKSSRAAAPAAAAGAGTGVSVQYQVTPGGLKDIVTDTDTEVFVAAATVEDMVTVFERVHRETDANSRGSAPAASAGGGVIVKATAKTNPLGSKDISVERTEERPVARAASSASGDLFQTLRETRDDNIPDAGDGTTGVITPGVIKSTSRQVTPGGRVKATTRTETHKLVMRSRRQVASTCFGRTLVEGDDNAPAPFPDPGAGECVTIASERTRADLYNRSRTTHDIVDGVLVSETKGGEVRFNWTRRTYLVKTKVDEPTGLLPGTHTLREITWTRRQEDGYYEKQVYDRVAIVNTNLYSSLWKSYSEKVRQSDGSVYYVLKKLDIQTFINAPRADVQAAFDAFADPSSVGVQISLNEYGLWDGTISCKTTLSFEDEQN